MKPLRFEYGKTPTSLRSLQPILPAKSPLFSRPAWTGIGICGIVLCLLPILNLSFPDGHALHISSYTVALIAKFMCYAMAALALDLV